MIITMPKIVAASAAIVAVMIAAASRDDGRPALKNEVVEEVQAEPQASTPKADRELTRPSDDMIIRAYAALARIDPEPVKVEAEAIPPVIAGAHVGAHAGERAKGKTRNHKSVGRYDLCRGKGKIYTRGGKSWRCRR